MDSLQGTREAPGRQERTNWTAWEAPGKHQGGRKGLVGQPGRHQGGTREAGTLKPGWAIGFEITAPLRFKYTFDI